MSKKIKLRNVKLEIVILLSKFHEWKVNGVIPNYIIPLSLSGDVSNDEHFILMIASNRPKKFDDESQWSDLFVNNIQKLFKII